MISKKCSKCSKVVEGYTEKHAEYMLKQHKLSKHDEDDSKNGKRK